MDENAASAGLVALHAKARAAISAGVSRPPRGQLLLRCAVLPSRRAAPSAWELFALLDLRREVQAYAAARSDWDAESDLAAPGATPTIRVQNMAVPTSVAKSVLARLSGVAVPLLPGAHPHGTGGTSYLLVLGENFAHATFAWWESGPSAWQPLVAAFHDTRTSLEALLLQSPPL
jgi:hypothetical protein